MHDTGASSFLYPFLGESEHDLEAVVEDVRRSVLAKAQEVAELRAQTLPRTPRAGGGRGRRCARSSTRAGALLALGNGGSATDAMDVVADFRRPPDPRWRPRRAIDLTEDAAILTAIANDIGTEAIFSRQVIAHGRAGDALLAISTSGNSANVIHALAEARRRGLRTIAMVGYDGGRVAAERLADHVVVTRSEHIPRIQEAQASAYHVLRELVGRVSRVRARVEGTVQGVGFRPYVYRLAGELGVAGHVLNDARGVVVEVEAEPETVDRFLARLAAEAPPLAQVERVVAEAVAETGERGFSSARARAAASRARRSRRTAPPARIAWRSCSTPPTAAIRYPFINCTNCGPRFTIVRDVPYDRPHTTMAGFAMCAGVPARVRRPGRPPLSRAAQRVPRVRAAAAAWPRGADAADPLAAAARALLAGRDRRDQGAGRLPPRVPARTTEAAVARAARAQASRGEAVRPDGAGSGGRRASSSTLAPAEGELLLSRAAADRAGAPAARTPRWRRPWRRRPRELGVMLPYSPLHHLLLADVGTAAGDDQRQRVRRADRLPRRGRPRAAGRDRGPLPAARPADRDAHGRLRRARGRRGRPQVLRRSRGYVPDRRAAARRARAHRCSRAAPS